jgi:hypothetical protein
VVSKKIKFSEFDLYFFHRIFYDKKLKMVKAIGPKPTDICKERDPLKSPPSADIFFYRL